MIFCKDFTELDKRGMIDLKKNISTDMKIFTKNIFHKGIPLFTEFVHTTSLHKMNIVYVLMIEMLQGPIGNIFSVTDKI